MGKTFKIILLVLVIFVISFAGSNVKYLRNITYSILPLSQYSNNYSGAALTSAISKNQEVSDGAVQSEPQQTSGQTFLPDQSPTFGKQEKVDDMLDKVNLLKYQIAELEVAESLKNQKQNQNQIIPKNQTQPQSILPSTNDTGDGNDFVYSKILISEIQITGKTDAKEEFVELYNPNNSDVDLTGWYIHRSTKTSSHYSTFASNTLFMGER